MTKESHHGLHNPVVVHPLVGDGVVMRVVAHYLPGPDRIPACPRCGDREKVHRVIAGLPSAMPAHEEWDRIEFAVCGKDDHPTDAGWWCPSCFEAYG